MSNAFDFIEEARFWHVELSVRSEQVINGKVVTNRQLETLDAVASTGSKTAAASKLGISVPVVHRYIAAIEEAAGCEVTRSTPAGTYLTPEGKLIVDTFRSSESRCSDRRGFTVCCTPVTEDLIFSVLSALKMTDVEVIITDDSHNIRIMKENLADLAIVDDPLFIFDADEFDGAEIGTMGMVMVDNGPSFIRYRYGAQRVAFMFLDTLNREYTVDSETYSLAELLGSDKSYFVDEFLLLRKGLRIKSAVDPKILRHTITAIYRTETPKVRKIVRALQARHIE